MEKYSETRERILKVAKEEFLQYGFQKASLRNIVKQAGVTTGAFYGYYKNKENLFDELVKEGAGEFYQWYKTIHEDYTKQPAGTQKEELMSISGHYIPIMVHYIYERFEVFKLLFCCSAGTVYEDYADSLIELEVESAKVFIRVLEDDGAILIRDMDDTLLHIISSAVLQELHELIAHDVPEDKAVYYLQVLSDFQHAGWKGMLGI